MSRHDHSTRCRVSSAPCSQSPDCSICCSLSIPHHWSRWQIPQRSHCFKIFAMMMLDPRAAAAGVRLVTHQVLSSTNAEALNLARQGERGPLWIVAERQTAGRGRRGRAWISEDGNVFASLLLTISALPECRPQLSLVAALAVHDAVVEIAASVKPRITIKWPNDLLLDRAKLAGILVEGEGGGDGAAAIGIGINCTSHPADTDYPATDLAAAGI